ncbi:MULTISPECIES: hypothetical protein [Peribacillus]|uniref:hypothetical protein n=1 Tax=Peribacillus TaxID=2675229 RepID=UPI001F4E495D|nr:MULTISPECIES: hypothetical protein [unclassified Peribacillus]MCK1982203.1 hypothetical protein [Peribacillus sp. Aquil_B1]MCK2007445.1 hypothetical protein [Peribacillus sp. Aquil_B8]
MEFRPVPKPVSKPKEKPRYKERRPKKKPKKKNTNVLMFHNRRIPHWKQRGAVPKKEAIKALHFYGEHCAVCMSPEYQLHHVTHKGYGIGGRGVWRNLVPLCGYHHTGDGGPHKNIETVDKAWKEAHEKIFGSHYFKDAYDLWMEGLISSPTEDLLEAFMEGEGNEKIRN